jgi:signal transduction histidine kinase
MDHDRPVMPSLARSLSSRLLLLTIAFVMIGEVLIYVPSIARFRLAYLQERLSAAHQAALAVEAAPGGRISPRLASQLLAHAKVASIAIRRESASYLMLGQPPAIAASYDLADPMVATLILDAFAVLGGADGLVGVRGPSPADPATEVEVTLDEGDLRAAMLDYSGRILVLSIVISLIAAGCVFLALQWMIVRPLRRLTEGLVAFRSAPEDASRQAEPQPRGDEIGFAQAEFANLQRELRASLRQRARLAAIGAAVSKIGHDLRNILATAALVSDRLAGSGDPEVRRQAPFLIAAIDRAVSLCEDALSFARADEPELRLTRFPLAPLVEEVRAAVAADPRIVWENTVGEDVTLRADRDQVFRVLLNLARNAAEAMAGGGVIRIEAEAAEATLVIRVADTGPGLPPRARDNLFRAFVGGAKPGGSGLGLAIARELVLGHGGELELVATGPGGTVFRIVLPRQPGPPG